MAEIRELVLTFLEHISINALPKNRKRETLDACILGKATSFPINKQEFPWYYFLGSNGTIFLLENSTNWL